MKQEIYLQRSFFCLKEEPLYKGELVGFVLLKTGILTTEELVR